MGNCLLLPVAGSGAFTRGYQALGIMEEFRFGLLIAWFIVAIYFLGNHF